ncbi:MAG: arginyltransferase [Pseudomonadota bacterium]
MALPTVRVLQTLEHRCGYYADRQARNLVIDPTTDGMDGIYDAVVHSGFRRAGDLVFRPHCRQCSACRATRIDVSRFRPNRAQRRCLGRNEDLSLSIAPAAWDDFVFDLYRRYLGARHPGGGMDNPRPEDFEGFLLSKWSRSFFVQAHLGRRLIAVAVCDQLASGLSAVYTFFDPEEKVRSLGNWCILKQIEHAASLELPYLYLGYWLPEHPKMDYKRRFRPIEVFENGAWRTPAA